MWARRVQAGSRHAFSRTLQTSIRRQINGAHKTYFQPPPPPPRPRFRVFRTIFFGTLCAGAGAGIAFYYGFPLYMFSMVQEIEEINVSQSTAMYARLAKDAGALAGNHHPPALDEAQAALDGYDIDVTPTTIAHLLTLPSNFPCEDHVSGGRWGADMGNDQIDWPYAAIFDGHAGAQLSSYISAHLVNNVMMSLVASGAWKRPFTPNDPFIARAMKKAFLDTDKEILIGAEAAMKNEVDRTNGSALGSLAFSGTCALLAFFDPVKSVLHVANVGDSRAVLGRWDDQQQKYVAIPLSKDQTGFNPDEVARMEELHPGENPIDPKTGRTHGLAVTRAFGDARWKWPQELNKRAHEFFFGPKPLPDDKIISPPYITAEPEITNTKINDKGDHPDFLIMASDGLWDLMSSEDAVTAIQLWLDKFQPVHVVEHVLGNHAQNLEHAQGWLSPFMNPPTRRQNPQPEEPRSSYLTPADLLSEEEQEEHRLDTYYDPVEKCTKWQVNPSHFVVEDMHAGAHLVKNALGGKRRNLFRQVMVMQAPLSRNVRDDISVYVWFFGRGGGEELQEKLAALTGVPQEKKQEGGGSWWWPFGGR